MPEDKKFEDDQIEDVENQSELAPDTDVEEPAGENAQEPEPTDEEPDTFPREYVEKLRDENAKYRQRAQKVDDYAQRLHGALVAATGALQDADDLPYDESHLDDPEALQSAIQELLEKKPHLGSRKPSGNIGQGVSQTTDTIDLAAMLRSRA